MYAKQAQVVVYREGLVYTRSTRKGAREHYRKDLQDWLLLEGFDSLRRVAMRYYHSFASRRDLDEQVD